MCKQFMQSYNLITTQLNKWLLLSFQSLKEKKKTRLFTQLRNVNSSSIVNIDSPHRGAEEKQSLELSSLSLWHLLFQATIKLT